MMQCDLETSIPDWLIDFPEVAPLLAEFGITSCCGGRSLEYVCRERGLDPHFVLARLRAEIDPAEKQDR